MKKIGILAIILMLMTVVTTAQAATRAGGLPELATDPTISDCPNCVVIINLNVEFDSDKAVVKDQYRE